MLTGHRIVGDVTTPYDVTAVKGSPAINIPRTLPSNPPGLRPSASMFKRTGVHLGKRHGEGQGAQN